ncbi:MAG: Rrf2 family transcriptional regulator [Flavobacteriales bacterium]|nr:Rrf2 family transcriptional regulator [Flavobacteriales bacterium]
MFSKACEYGIRATIYIAWNTTNDKRVNLKQISKEIGSPEAFTAKILQQLVRSEVITSVKGALGGFTLNTSTAPTLMLSTLVAAIDGDTIYRGCGLGLKSCNSKKPCPMHGQFMLVREQLREMLENTSINDLLDDYGDGRTYLNRLSTTQQN